MSRDGCRALKWFQLNLGSSNRLSAMNYERNFDDMNLKNRQVFCERCKLLIYDEGGGDKYQSCNIALDVVALLLNECCGNKSFSCWTMKHDDQPLKDVTYRLFQGYVNWTIVYPVIVDLKNPNNDLVELVPPTDISFLVPRDKERSFPMRLLLSVFDAWPVLILTFLLSILAGMILWVTEIRANPDEFPRTFIRGSWEGFWWAFVSMTTVGYGDRSPRSFLGRMFAVCWILIGICIVSIFTATLTTALTTISMDTKKAITGSKIGVLERSIELSIAIQQQTDIKVYSSIGAIKQALDDKLIEGALLDKYVIHYYKNLFPDEHFKIDEVIPQDKSTYGAVVNDSRVNHCFHQILQHDRFIVYNFIRKLLQRTMKSWHDEAVKNSQSIFDPTGDLFYPSLYSCVIIVIVIVIIGIMAEVFYLKPMHCITQRSQCYTVNEPIEMTNTNLKKLEREMMNEINEIIKKYQDKIKQNKGYKS